MPQVGLAGSWHHSGPRRLLAAGCWLLAADCWLLAADCWLLAAGCWLLAIDPHNATAADTSAPAAAPFPRPDKEERSYSGAGTVPHHTSAAQHCPTPVISAIHNTHNHNTTPFDATQTTSVTNVIGVLYITSTYATYNTYTTSSTTMRERWCCVVKRRKTE